MYQYSNSLIRQFSSAVTGNAAVGIQATVYVGETSTLASLFEVNGSPKSNPVTTDSKGFYSFSVADGDYRIVFSSSQFATLRISVLDGAAIREEFDSLVASNAAFISEQQSAYDAFVLSQGWDQVGTFAAGFTFTSPNQVGQDVDGNWWRWNGSFPKVVTAGTLPSSDANYKLVGDGVLRSELAEAGSEVLIADVEAGELVRKYNETPSLPDYGAVGDLTADDTSAVASAIATLEQEILVPSKKRFLVTALSNLMGKRFKGSGTLLKPIGTDVYQQLNSYMDKENPIIDGYEYIAAWHNLIGNQEDTPTRQPIAVFSGDSTTEGVGVTDGNLLNQLFVNVAFKRGLQTPYGINAINRGFAGESIADWFNNRLAGDLAANPDLLVLRWGINHPEAAAGGVVPGGTPQLSPLRQTPEQWIAVLRNGLTTIRASRSVGSLSIILMTPNSTSDSPNARDEMWYEAISAGIKQAARDFNCVFIDTYAAFRDSRDAADIWMDNPFGDGRAIHPFNVMNRWINELICSVALPLGMSDIFGVNSFRNFGGLIDTGETEAAPNQYPFGLTVARAQPPAYPFSGTVHTMRSRDNIVSQMVYPFTGSSRFAVRVGRAAAIPTIGWEPFTIIESSKQNLKITAATGYNSPVSGGLRAVSNNNLVVVEGTLAKDVAGTISAGTQIGGIPTALRPLHTNVYCTATLFGGAAFEENRVSFNTDGSVKLVNSTALSVELILINGCWSLDAAT